MENGTALVYRTGKRRLMVTISLATLSVLCQNETVNPFFLLPTILYKKREAELHMGEASHAAPDNERAGWGISGPRQIPAELGKLQDAPFKRSAVPGRVVL